MPSSEFVDVKKLAIDLENPRTTSQKNEHNAIVAMIDVGADRFYAVVESLLDNGYLANENIVVLKEAGKLIVKEGNRRVAAMKLISGLADASHYELPQSLKDRIAAEGKTWYKNNRSIPCVIYSTAETAILDKVIDLTHAKSEKAARDPWPSVARARRNRDKNGAREWGLDMLEKYLKKGSTLNDRQKASWAGDYPVTVLDAALPKLIGIYGFEKVEDLIKKYPNVDHNKNLENALRDIGLKRLGFSIVRSDELYTKYKFPIPKGVASLTVTPASKSRPAAKGKSKAAQNPDEAQPLNSPQHVKKKLKHLTLNGKDREKVASLRDEMHDINIQKTPMAFCFVLRSAVEISAYAYCKENDLSTTTSAGKALELAEILKRVYTHLTANETNKEMVKELHGARQEFINPARFLSVTSMNQLLHNPKFSVQAGDICTAFAHVFPLLQAMNA